MSQRYAAFGALLRRHATWLGLELDERRYALAGDAVGVVVRLRPAAAANDPLAHETSTHVVVPAGGTRSSVPVEPSSEMLPSHASTDQPILLRLDLRTGELVVDVPLIHPDHVYYTEDERGLVVGTDLRPLLRWTDQLLDPVAVAALLQYGTVPSPHSLGLRVHRVPCGHRMVCAARADGPTVRAAVDPIASWSDGAEIADPDAATLRRLDRVLHEVPQGAVVFFSGGVDSGLTAARLSEIGRRDVRLVNYAFGADDEESRGAEQMAAHLGLPFERILYDIDGIAPLCRRIARDFSFPFGDLSVIPSHLMVLAAESTLARSRAAVLGVGADDLYEGGLKVRSWRRLLDSPRPLRRLVVAALGPLRPRRRNDRVRKVWGIARRSLLSRHEFGPLVMHNDLAGIGYRMDPAVQASIEEAWRKSIDVFSEGLVAEDRLSLMYLMNGGMGWEAPKFDGLRRLGVRSYYPFLDGAMLPHGYALTWDQKCEGRKHKVLLKRLLARSVPPAMVERPKRGFSPPFGALLGIAEVQEIFRAALIDRSGPLDGFLDRRIVRSVLDAARRGRVQGRSEVNLLWVMLFTTCWLDQLREALP